jgi:YHYH protein
MRTRALLSLGVACLLLGSIVVGGSSGASTTAAHRTSSKRHVTATTAQSERSALTQMKWTSNVAVTFSDGSWTFRSDGVPSSRFTASHYAVPANPLAVSAVGASVIATSQVLRNQNYSFTLPTTPKYSSTTTTNLGAIGVLLDGAVLYNPYEANKETVATQDNFTATANGTTASFLDSCDGHPGPGGQYHYHGLPDCLVQYATTGASSQTMPVTSFSGSTTAAAAETNAAARKPVLLGFAFDGYGIYDNVAMNGRTIGVASLDSCNGIFSPVPGYPHGVYHYVLENVKSDRSSLGCYHGVVSTAYIHALKDSINGLAGGGPGGSSPPPGPPPAQGLSGREGPIPPVAETAERLAAKKGQVIILTDELEDLDRGGLC